MSCGRCCSPVSPFLYRCNPNSVLLPETRKQILTVLADGQFHSGEALSQQLGISRSAIWKQLKLLDQVGLRVDAVSGKGYRLYKPLDLMRRQDILAALEQAVTEQIETLHLFDVLESTNSFLLARDNAAKVEVCLTEYQSAGKGRHGRQWVSPFGGNIYLSVLWQYQQGPAALAGLSLAIGVAVVRALLGQGVEDIGLKWPNDIFHQQRKLGGILVELTGDAEGPCTVVVGIGLNVSLSVDDAGAIDQPWVDLDSIQSSQRIGRNRLIAAILNELIPVLADFENNGIGGYIEEWRGYDCMLGRQVRLATGLAELAGEVLGIDDNGLLKLRLNDGNTGVYASGEVSFQKR